MRLILTTFSYYIQELFYAFITYAQIDEIFLTTYMGQAIPQRGVPISGVCFSDADYADDVATIEGSPEEIAETLKRIETASSELGLHISWTKTKIQNIGAGPVAPDLLINGQVVEGVDKFVYLGSTICSVDGSRSEQMRRIGLAAANMNNLASVWSQSHLSTATKLRLYMTLIVPILLYASETWTVNKVDLDRLQAFHMRCQRRILNVRWFDKIKNVIISSRTGLPPIGDMIQNRRHSLFGHVVRMDPMSPANQALMLCRDISMSRRLPADWKRPRGRPRNTWVGQIKKDGGVPISTAWTRADESTNMAAGAWARRPWRLRGAVSE